MVEYIAIGAGIYQMYINGKPLNYAEFGLFLRDRGFYPSISLKESAKKIYNINDNEQYNYICSILRGRTEELFYTDYFC